MGRKSKGISAERDLIHRFWQTGVWVAHRIAGSGSSRYPSPDIIASNNLRKIAIECKTSKEKKVYIQKQEIDELKKFGQMFGAESWTAVKFNGQPWFFITLEDLEEKQTTYCVTLESAKSIGLLFEEMI
ncbi:MAG: Holliday junction resolvase Hjc [Nanobdellota archaeon]